MFLYNWISYSTISSHHGIKPITAGRDQGSRDEYFRWTRLFPVYLYERCWTSSVLLSNDGKGIAKQIGYQGVADYGDTKDASKEFSIMFSQRPAL